MQVPRPCSFECRDMVGARLAQPARQHLERRHLHGARDLRQHPRHGPHRRTRHARALPSLVPQGCVLRERSLRHRRHHRQRALLRAPPCGATPTPRATPSARSRPRALGTTRTPRPRWQTGSPTSLPVAALNHLMENLHTSYCRMGVILSDVLSLSSDDRPFATTLAAPPTITHSYRELDFMRAHNLSLSNERKIESVEPRSRYFCLSIFRPNVIKDWVDDAGRRTALLVARSAPLPRRPHVEMP